MRDPLKVVIVGGVAAGPKVVSKIIRLMLDAQVTIVKEGELLSCAGCELPYYVSGVVKEQKELMSMPLGVVRDRIFFQKVKNVHVLNPTEATEIDPTGKHLRVKSVTDGNDSWLDYNKLVLATGASPVLSPIDGAEPASSDTRDGARVTDEVSNILACPGNG